MTLKHTMGLWRNPCIFFFKMARLIKTCSFYFLLCQRAKNLVLILDLRVQKVFSLISWWGHDDFCTRISVACSYVRHFIEILLYQMFFDNVIIYVTCASHPLASSTTSTLISMFWVDHYPQLWRVQVLKTFLWIAIVHWHAVSVQWWDILIVGTCVYDSLILYESIWIRLSNAFCSARLCNSHLFLAINNHFTKKKGEKYNKIE